jgi:predicted transcriptional regulator
MLETDESKPDRDYYLLDEHDFRILQHHQVVGVDYAWVVADTLNLEPQLVFERHKKLKDLKLLKRVQPVMIQYRKNIVDHKWIKHRNHTYYRITPKGERYLNFFIGQKDKDRT